MVWLVAGMLIVSLSLSYAWWVKVRVVCLRQDIYDLRDRLFDRASDMRVLDDPAYLDVREHLNAVAASAEMITVPVLAFLLHNGVQGKPFVKSGNAELQKVIDETIELCVCRIVHYLRWETFTGIIILPIVLFDRLGTILEDQALKWVRRWLFSRSPEEIESVGRLAARHVLASFS